MKHAKGVGSGLLRFSCLNGLWGRVTKGAVGGGEADTCHVARLGPGAVDIDISPAIGSGNEQGNTHRHAYKYTTGRV